MFVITNINTIFQASKLNGGKNMRRAVGMAGKDGKAGKPQPAGPSVIPQIGNQQPLCPLQIWIKSQTGPTRGTCLSEKNWL